VLDAAIIACGAVAVVFSFRGYYTVSVAYVTDSTSAWHGFFGWFGTVLATAAAALVAAAMTAGQRRLPLPAHLMALILFVLGAASTFAALFSNGYDTHRRIAGATVDTGHGYGYWVSLAATLLGAVLTAVRVGQSGWRAVWSPRGSGTLGFETEGAGKPGEGDTA
jgi:hypothetical protein